MTHVGVALTFGLVVPALTPDGTRVAVLDLLGSQLDLLDAATGRLLRTLNASNRGTLGPAARIAFSPDGRRIACEFR